MVVQRARKKPVEIDFMRHDGTQDSAEAIVFWTIDCNGGLANADLTKCAKVGPAGTAGVSIDIPTLEGTMRASPGDVVIRGVKGEFYPCKPEVFEATYDVLKVVKIDLGELFG